MPRRLRLLGPVLLLTAGVAISAQDAANWSPSTAAQQKNPLQPTPQVLSRGKALYASQCQRCHGVEGRNDGPDADRAEATADLTDASRAAINPDGTVFYTIWHGRFRPFMPAFGAGVTVGKQDAKGALSEEDVWAIVAYVQTLRR